MATPYFQFRLQSVSSTQDVARERLGDLPVLVIASEQTEGRGRSGTGWLTADRALAVSYAWSHQEGDDRPFSLMAGVAAVRTIPDARLKWPNDVLVDGGKVGGILVERSAGVTVVGLGLNLWWSEPTSEMPALYDNDPGEDSHVELGSLWGANLAELIADDGWPIDEYRVVCDTIGRQIEWEPQGRGEALDVADDGGLVVNTGDGARTLYSGAIRHVRVVGA